MSGFPLGRLPAGTVAGSASPGLAALALGLVLRALAGGLDVMAPQMSWPLKCHGRAPHHKSASPKCGAAKLGQARVSRNAERRRVHSIIWASQIIILPQL